MLCLPYAGFFKWAPVKKDTLYNVHLTIKTALLHLAVKIALQIRNEYRGLMGVFQDHTFPVLGSKKQV
jgi:hypothetical protein